MRKSEPCELLLTYYLIYASLSKKSNICLDLYDSSIVKVLGVCYGEDVVTCLHDTIHYGSDSNIHEYY